MLRKLIIRNINSVDVCEIDFTKGNYKFANENILGDYVNPIVIYGHNGSGKSSVMSAMAQFITLLTQPVESLGPFIVNNFLFEEYAKDQIHNQEKVKGSVELCFDIGNDVYVYYLETSRHLSAISKEYLLKNQEEYFKRDDKELIYKGEKKAIGLMYRLAPSLRTLASSEISDVTIQMVFAQISSYTHINVSYINRGSFVTSKLFVNANTYDLLVEKSEEVKKILKEYDNFPVYSIKKSELTAPNGITAPQYDIVFDDGSFKGQLPMAMISTGMQNQSVLLSLLLSMPKDSVLFIDELDIALHPSAIQSFLKVVRERQIQVVMSLHNTNAMQILRPDQVYFAKWKKGFSYYYRLSKIYPNIREINNMEKMYLSSLFDEAIKE